MTTANLSGSPSTSNPAGLPGVQHVFSSIDMHGYIQDINSATASVSSAYLRVPYRVQIMKLNVTTFAAQTVANTTLTFSLNGVAIAGATIVIPTAGSAAGLSFSSVPNPLAYANEGDVISVTSDHGGTGVCPCAIDLVLKAR
jgi:hypothetical protein